MPNDLDTTYGPYAATVYYDNQLYQMTLDWSYKSIYLKIYDCNTWLTFTTDLDLMDFGNVYYLNPENIWYHNKQIFQNCNLYLYGTIFENLKNKALNHKNNFNIVSHKESEKSFELLERMEILFKQLTQ